MLKKAIIFAAGLGIGSIAGWRFADKHCRALAEDEIESVKAHFRKKVESEAAEKGTEDVKEKYESVRKTYGAGSEDVEDEGEDYIREEAPVEKGGKPRIIKAEEFFRSDPAYSKVSLFYYVEDGILADEEENLVDNVGYLLGDALTKYRFIDSDERVIYVRNSALSTDYEITKVNAAYADLS